MPAVILSLLIFCLSAGATQIVDTNEPRFVLKNGIEKFILPEKANAALQAWNKSFQIMDTNVILKELTKTYKKPEYHLPVADVGDYNGDGFKDMILLGTTTKKQHAVLVVTSGSDWEVKELKSWNYKDPKKVKTQVGEKELVGYPHSIRTVARKRLNFGKSNVSKRDAFLIDTYWGNSVAYYLKGDEIKVYNGQIE